MRHSVKTKNSNAVIIFCFMCFGKAFLFIMIILNFEIKGPSEKKSKQSNQMERINEFHAKRLEMCRLAWRTFTYRQRKKRSLQQAKSLGTLKATLKASSRRRHFLGSISMSICVSPSITCDAETDLFSLLIAFFQKEQRKKWSSFVMLT